MKLGWFGVAMAPFGLEFGPAGPKWCQDLKKHGFGVPEVTWGPIGILLGSWALLAPLESKLFNPGGCSLYTPPHRSH